MIIQGLASTLTPSPMSDAVSIVLKLTNALLSTAAAYAFFTSFARRSAKKQNTVILSALCVLICFAAYLFFDSRALGYASIFVAFGVLSFAINVSFLNKMLLSSILTACVLITETLTKTALVTLFGVSLKLSTRGLYYISIFAVSKALLLLISYLVRVYKHKAVTEDFADKYMKVLAFPVSTVLAMLLQHSLLLSIKSHRYIILAFVLITDVALLASNMIVFDYIDSLYDNAVHKSKIAHANKLIELQTAQYRAMVENSYKLNKTKHDFKNFCIGLVAELNAGNTAAVEEKLCEVYEEAQLIKTDTANVIELLLQAKAEDAARREVSLQYECCNLPELRFSDVDLSIILGNAIDNAIEACERLEEKRTVEVFVAFRNNIVIITVKNPVKENVDVNALHSTKADKAMHGFGIISMKQLVEKYEGELIFSCENESFTTTVIMNNAPAAQLGN